LVCFLNVSYFGVRLQKTALLVFSALAFVSAKTKCAVCAAGSFFNWAQLVYMRIKPAHITPIWVDKRNFML